MKKLFLFILVIVLHTPTQTKGQDITSLAISPSIAINNINTFVVAQTLFYSSPCALNSSLISISGFTINVYSRHDIGTLSQLCTSTYTIPLGILQQWGNYCLYYHLIDNFTQATYDIDTICFAVQIWEGLQDISPTYNNFEIYPNPTTSNLDIRPLTDSYKRFNIELFNIYGQKLYSLLNADSIATIDISGLPNGTYILTLTCGDKRQRTKIIKNAP